MEAFGQQDHYQLIPSQAAPIFALTRNLQHYHVGNGGEKRENLVVTATKKIVQIMATINITIV